MEATFYEPRNKEGKILAFADVGLDEGITIRGFRIVNGSNGLFAGVPSRPVTVEGQTQYFNQVVFASDKKKEEFLAELLHHYETWRQNREATPSPV